MTQQFYQKIPLSRALGLKIIALEESEAQVFVPLDPNINHVGSVFGGSIYSASALACYALFQSIAQKAGGLSDEIVIQEGQIKYLSPILGDFQIFATPDDPGAIDQFIQALRRHGRARLNLTAQSRFGGKVCAQFSGIYVYSNKNILKNAKHV